MRHYVGIVSLRNILQGGVVWLTPHALRGFDRSRLKIERVKTKQKMKILMEFFMNG